MTGKRGIIPQKYTPEFFYLTKKGIKLKKKLKESWLERIFGSILIIFSIGIFIFSGIRSSTGYVIGNFYDISIPKIISSVFFIIGVVILINSFRKHFPIND